MDGATIPLADRIATLNQLHAAGMDAAGLGRLLIEWIRESAPTAQCELRLRQSDGILQQTTGEISDADSRLKIRHRFVLESDGGDYGDLLISIPADDASIDSNGIDALCKGFAWLLECCRRLEDAELLALRDELTGLGNRRMLLQSLRKWIDRARKERLPLSILLLDIDHFKHFNDSWGHEAGDKALKMVSNLMTTVFRQDDVIARYGGEEFAVILCDRWTGQRDGSAPREALMFAERLRREAERLQLTSDDGRILASITLSGGIATFPWDAGSAEELLRAADSALYAAKRAGRNRIFLAADSKSEAIAG